MKNGAKQRRARRHRAIIEIATTMIQRKLRDAMNEQIDDVESAIVKASELYGFFLDVPIWYPKAGPGE